MAGRVQGKVVFITGGARGQGRNHALRLAAEGADVVLFDICHDLKTVAYDLASPEDLADTVAAIEGTGRKAIGIEGDVRDFSALEAAVDRTIETFGKLDVVLANAGISGRAPGHEMAGWAATAGTNIVGVMNTFHAALPSMNSGGSAIATGSFAALKPGGIGREPSSQAYSYAKRALIEYVKRLAAAAGGLGIRVNGVHPTNTNTRLLHNDQQYRAFRPDLEHPTREDVLPAFASMHLLPDVPYIESDDVTNAVLYLASDESRYVTGQFIAIDAGAHLKLLD
ncbi:MAG: mycofactocin-coupled SDR family oxidoreductase [Acidimicrobiales bacterium]|nr:mycofactocin-coupled SDR family oxidoreductase [Acidimicrobiales bacterium]